MPVSSTFPVMHRRPDPDQFRLPNARRVAIDDPDAYRPDSLLRRLADRVRERRKVELDLHACLPLTLRDQARFGSLRDGELCLLFDSAAWLTRARYQQHALLAALHQHPQFAGVERLRFAIQPEPRTARKTGRL